jgi:hypothetical protein
MDVIGHQAIGPDCCAGAPRCRGDQTPIEKIVVGFEKHRLAAITALGDIVRQVPHNNAHDPAVPVFPSANADVRDGYSGALQSGKLSP